MGRARLPLVLALALSGPLYFFAYQAHPNRHFGIGYWDGLFLANEDDFYPAFRTSGPFRHPDQSVEVREFVARLTKPEAAFTLPYHAIRSPLRFSLRCHRFGLEGAVELTVNGELIDAFVFATTSYPWGGITAVISESVAARGPLAIEVTTRDGRPPPDHLPSDLGIGVDWIEVEPMSGGVWLLPSAAEWIRWFLFVGLGIALVLYLRLTPLATNVLTIGLVAGALFAVAFYPVVAVRALASSWLAFPALIAAIALAEILDRRSPSTELAGAGRQTAAGSGLGE